VARITSLWRSGEISVHRFDHPAEHEDQPYEAVASQFSASFVDAGTFDLEVGEERWRMKAGDVLLGHPGMRYRAGFDGEGFSDTCLTLIYLSADDDAFDRARTWAGTSKPILRASNRVRYLRWGLKRALEQGEPMFAEFCATEIFRARNETGAQLFREHKFAWYAERVHAIRERLDAEFERDHSVSELARSVGMSMFHFTRVFGQLVGQPPHRYLLEARLRAARSMLREGRGVTETCFACGFNNLSHFSRRFSRHFGVAPSLLVSRNSKEVQATRARA
jgi:AraC family transcriptional regulator